MSAHMVPCPRCSGRSVEKPDQVCQWCRGTGEVDANERLPPDLERVLRDQSIIVPQDGAVFASMLTPEMSAQIAEWANAPSDTPSAAGLGLPAGYTMFCDHCAADLLADGHKPNCPVLNAAGCPPPESSQPE